MKQRTFFSVLAAVVLVLLLSAARGFAGVFANSPLSLLAGGSTANPAAAIFVPATAPAMVSLLVNPKQLETLGQLATPPKQRRDIRRYFEDLENNLVRAGSSTAMPPAFFDKLAFRSAGLNYRQDIESWLGDEITFAVTGLDIDRDTSNGNLPGYLLAIATRSPERSRQFLDVFWQEKATAGAKIISEPYQGATLIYDAAGTSWASAVVGQQFVLFANSPKVLRDAINNVQVSGLSLNTSKTYRQSLETLTQPRTLLAFVNLAQLTALKSVDIPVLNSVARRQEGSFSSNETLTLALGFNRSGIKAESALLLPQANLDSAVPSLTGPVGALTYIPANVGVLSAGTNLAGLWNTLAGSEDTALFKLITETISSGGSRWGIDIGQDIFNSTKGEYAIGLLPNSGNSSADWIFVAQKSPENAEFIERLDNIATTQGFSVGPVRLGNQEISAWTKLSASQAEGKAQPVELQAQVRGAHTGVGEYEIFASSLEVIEKALKAKDGENALANNSFRAGIAALPVPNSGYVYLDWGTTQTVLERQFPIFKLVEVAAAPVFQHLRSLTLTSTGGEAGVRRADVFVLVGS
ncbi:DUF3352 domain-containing protein [Ancylothrix sp. C2]|uniref:DUF3352 domain-containing protein n=1 Tax=Ancylothrix sp. D3o TaxID=2953691 RepID=UPI0021BA8B2B|nr:DUF3352 domain-containing protein [Ancylothrix sp. D3o]MCT7948693.1 DUF3352 domain-containing protein [Ancylothrix sp. D3o]